MDARLLRPIEVATVLGISRATAYGLIASGQLPAVRIGRCVRVSRVALDRWIDERETCGAPPLELEGGPS